MLTKHQAIFLGISREENKVLGTLHKKPQNIFLLSKSTRIPRATLYLIIKKLYGRGLIRVKQEGKRFVYRTTSVRTLSAMLDEIADSLRRR